MKNVIAELNSAPTYEAQYSYLYKVLPDLTLDNLLDLYLLLATELDARSPEKENMLGITKSQILYLYNER